MSPVLSFVSAGLTLLSDSGDLDLFVVVLVVVCVVVGFLVKWLETR